MTDKLKVAFLAVVPDADSRKDRSFIETDKLQLLSIIAGDYKEAAGVAVQLAEEGYKAIELCAGFGNRGVQMISEAVDYKIPVGVVRFDNHPGLNNQSGDQLF